MTVTDLAPTSAVWPPQVTDRLDADEPWPHPAVKSGSASRPNQATRMNDSVSRTVSVGGRAENYKAGWIAPYLSRAYPAAGATAARSIASPRPKRRPALRTG